MRLTVTLATALGVALVAAAVAVFLWPLHADGVTGSGLFPHYPRYIGFAAFGPDPLPDHLTIADLRRYGVHVPQDAVDARRHAAAAVLAAGLAVLAIAAVATRFGDALRRRILGTG